VVTLHVKTRYAKTTDGLHIAYQVVGDGPFDLVFANSWCSHVELGWEHPPMARFYEQLSSFCRLILFDKRGTGLSDPVSGVPTVEDRMDDIRAVMDAVGSETAALLGASEGGATCPVFAATYPERTRALVLFSPFIVGMADEECPWAWPSEMWDYTRAGMEEAWGDPDKIGVELYNPSLAGNEAANAWYARYWRASASPSVALALLEVNTQIDIRPVLPFVRVPTLVLHRTDETWINVNYGRYAAAKIPGARLVELEGTDHEPWEQDSDAVVGEIQEFLTGVRSEWETDRVLATVLFTDIVDSTMHASTVGDHAWKDMLDAHDDMARRQLERFGGREVNTTGDGFLATFDGPARGIRCALAVRGGAARLGLEVRAGLHTGEVERRGADIGGIAVHVGQRISAAAGAGEVVVSSTVKDLVAGSQLTFDDLGEREVKGRSRPWRIFRVRTLSPSGAPPGSGRSSEAIAAIAAMFKPGVE
jgi:class 3 adenylate cyclase